MGVYITDIQVDPKARYTTIEITAANAGYMKLETAIHIGSKETLSLCAEFVYHYACKAVVCALKCTGPGPAGNYILMAGAIAGIVAGKHDKAQEPQINRQRHDWSGEIVFGNPEEGYGLASDVRNAFWDRDGVTSQSVGQNEPTEESPSQ